MNLIHKLYLTIIVLTITILVICGTAYYYLQNISDNGTRVGVKLAPLSDAAMEIKLTATDAHLWFEEIIAGDSNENIENIWKKLDKTLWYCDAILNGGKNDEGDFKKSDNPEVIEKIKKVKSSVQEFIKNGHVRYDISLSSTGIGSTADQNFDKMYDKIQNQLDQIMNNNIRNSDILYKAGLARFHLANGHLFFEEMLSGDEEAKFEHVKNDFNQSKKYILQLANKINKNIKENILSDFDVFEKAYINRNNHFVNRLLDKSPL